MVSIFLAEDRACNFALETALSARHLNHYTYRKLQMPRVANPS
uniref:Uncharacterized protein n=1 Tax=Vibrio alginolyticus TaxID=663 RepID=A0A510BP08_VIBAL|nr:hypothetical protein [Vibrio alginolyticus]